MIPTNKTNSQLSTPHGMAINQGVYDSAVRYLCGLVQCGFSLTWYNDWKSSGSPVNRALQNVTGASSKKKSSKKGNLKYYSAAIDCVLGHAPLGGILSAWYNNQKFGVSIVGASGVISGTSLGAFSFTPNGQDSKVTVSGNVPTTSPYQVTVPNFVADRNNVKVNGTKLNPADPAFPPGAGQYTATTAGVYTFNVAQAGGAYSIQYRELTSGGSATLAGIIAVTVHEPYSTTFNDFGGPGAVNVYGTWENPLWNARFAIPGRVDANAFRARDPYTWWWNGSDPTIYTPADLIGKPCTVYYGVPQILKSDGSFYSSTTTPMALLNLEFENAYAQGAEYANHLDQAIVLPWCAGVGSIEFDLMATNSMPNINLEVIGNFTLWPDGGCDVADVITDMEHSGPVLVGSGAQ